MHKNSYNENGEKINIRVLLIDIDPQANLTQSLLEKFGKDTKFYKEDPEGSDKRVLDYKCSVTFPILIENVILKD